MSKRKNPLISVAPIQRIHKSCVSANQTNWWKQYRSRNLFAVLRSRVTTFGSINSNNNKINSTNRMFALTIFLSRITLTNNGFLIDQKLKLEIKPIQKCWDRISGQHSVNRSLRTAFLDLWLWCIQSSSTPKTELFKIYLSNEFESCFRCLDWRWIRRWLRQCMK